MTAYLIISSFLNFVAGALLAFAVMLRGRKNEINLRFGLFTLCVGAWSAAYVLWQLSEDGTKALFFSRLLMVPAYFVPVLYLHFVARLCGEPVRWWLRAGYLGALSFMVLGFSRIMVSGVMLEMDFPFWPQAGPGFAVYLGFFAIYMLRSLLLLRRHARLSVGDRSDQFRYIFIATLVGFPGGATNFPLWYDVRVPPVGNGLIFLYLVIVALIISRYQLPLAAYDLVQAAIYLGMAATLAVCFLLIQMAVSRLPTSLLAAGSGLIAPMALPPSSRPRR